jgi:hypothetical protein
MSQQKLGLVTHCDINYLSRALALVESLRIYGETAPIYILCHDSISFEKLVSLNLKNLFPIKRDEMYALYPQLKDSENNRSPLEFYYCFSPFLLKYLEHLDYSDLIYLDSDLYFFDSLQEIKSLISDYEVGIVPHRFEPQDSHLEQYGIYNVGLVYIKNSRKALDVLEWWATSCISSTKLEVTPTSFGDQKYLNFFVNQGAKTQIFENSGHNAAPWNCSEAQVTSVGEIKIKGNPLRYYHFSGLRIYKRFATLGFTSYRKRPNMQMRKLVYRRYIERIIFWEGELDNPNRNDYRKIGIREILNALKYRDLIIFWFKVI